MMKMGCIPWKRSLSMPEEETTATARHSVEKIGGTSMSRFAELMDTILIGDRSGEDLYQRIFVVSAYGGMTNLLLEH